MAAYLASLVATETLAVPVMNNAYTSTGAAPKVAPARNESCTEHELDAGSEQPPWNFAASAPIIVVNVEINAIDVHLPKRCSNTNLNEITIAQSSSTTSAAATSTRMRDWLASSGSFAANPSSTNDAAVGGYQNRALCVNTRLGL